MAAQRVIVQPDASEDAVNDAEYGLRGWDEDADLRQQTDQRDLSEIDRFLGHVRRGQQHDLRSAIRISVRRFCVSKPRGVRRQTGLGLPALFGQPPLALRMTSL